MAGNGQISADPREELLKLLAKGKRRHKRTRDNSPQTQPAKKAKVSFENTSNVQNPTVAESATNPTPPDHLAGHHEITSMNIISSTKIEQKVTRTLSTLNEYPAIPPAKLKVVQLHAKAVVASKMITITEIAKREIAKGGGKWFQYNKVEEIMVEQKEVQEKDKGKKSRREEVNEDSDMEDEEDVAFETMKTPFERSIEGKPKVRGVPVMTIYLSRVRIDSLRKEYGEQTNALGIPKS